MLSVAKAVAPTTVAAGADTRMTITLTRAAGATALTGLAFTDTLPAAHLVSATPNLVNNCGGAVTATSGTNIVSLAGGSLAGGAAATSCTILVNVTTPAGAGALTNTIAAGTVTSAQGFVNPAAATATITRVVTSVTLNKSFNPATVLVGGTSQLTINVLNTNANAIALTTTGLVDTLPVGMVIATPPAATNTCGGALTAVGGRRNRHAGERIDRRQRDLPHPAQRRRHRHRQPDQSAHRGTVHVGAGRDQSTAGGRDARGDRRRESRDHQDRRCRDRHAGHEHDLHDRRQQSRTERGRRRERHRHSAGRRHVHELVVRRLGGVGLRRCERERSASTSWSRS